MADQIMAGGRSAEALVRGLVKLRSNNLVERPWGGLRMLDYKGCAPLPDQKKLTGLGVGEAFETAACSSDPESDQHPSVACLPDGSEILLPALLRCAGREILGQTVFEKFHGEIPLLPKTLDIEELLSVQAHPPGDTELYIIIDAEPGASIRLGFRHNIDRDALRRELVSGRQEQERLLTLLREPVDQNELQDILAPALAARGDDMSTTAAAMAPLLKDTSKSTSTHVAESLRRLKATYWHVLDLMNEITVKPGQIFYNATPERVCKARGVSASAEVHALGNPQRREILMLEIRRPGVTYRAWDNVRFPIREIDIDQTLTTLHLGATNPTEFERTAEALPGSPGVFRSVAGDCFVVDHIRPAKNTPVSIAGGHFHTLHAIKGSVTIVDNRGNTTQIDRGASAIAPATLDKYRVESDETAELIKVSLPRSLV